MRISQQMGCALHPQPATDQCYEPLSEALLKCSGWGELTRVVATCLRWRNKNQGIINLVEIWEAEEAIMGLSQSQRYRTSLARLRLNAQVNKDNTLAPLPFYRMPSARLHPFDHSAIDVAGPFQTKGGRSMVKRWLLVIRCSTTGAVHLEMID
jgi:hypothetical protein